MRIDGRPEQVTVVDIGPDRYLVLFGDFYTGYVRSMSHNPNMPNGVNMMFADSSTPEEWAYAKQAFGRGPKAAKRLRVSEVPPGVMAAIRDELRENAADAGLREE